MLTTSILNDYHEALELFAYERMSIVKIGPYNSLPMAGQSSNYNSRLMLVVISALTKLAARWQPLAARVMLCLAKVLRHQQYFDKTVINRANECIALLKFPRYAFVPF